MIRYSTHRTAAHPPWCDQGRCLSGLAGSIGEHRSAPLTLPGLPVVTLTRRPGGSTYVELRSRTRLEAVSGDGGRTHAAAIATAVATAIDAAMPSSDHDGYRDHDTTTWTGGQ